MSCRSVAASFPRRAVGSLARALGVALALGLSASFASAAQLSCQGEALTLDVDVNPSAGTCAVDGRSASLRKPSNPVVCHLSTPQLSILTIGSDGSFTWEDTSNRVIVRGNCVRL
ncbi:MAG: hypothetical protein AAGG09_14920 [Pseudomonadota bacterium]